MWYIYTMEYYSATKNNEFMKFLGKWMEIGNIITTYAMSAIDEGGTGSVQFQSDLYVHEYNETDYNIINSVILEIATDCGKMEILYSRQR